MKKHKRFIHSLRDISRNIAEGIYAREDYLARKMAREEARQTALRRGRFGVVASYDTEPCPLTRRAKREYRAAGSAALACAGCQCGLAQARAAVS